MCRQHWRCLEARERDDRDASGDKRGFAMAKAGEPCERWLGHAGFLVLAVRCVEMRKVMVE
jgi:hypothetical protein